MIIGGSTMELFSKKRTVVAIALSFTLGACGGGSDDTSDTLNENESYVETDSGGQVIVENPQGEIKTDGEVNSFAKISTLTGKHEYLGELAVTCSNDSSNYFETDKVVVFGSANLPVDDLKTAAALVEHQVEEVPQIFGTNWADYKSQRRNIAKFAIDNFVENYGDLPSAQSSLPSNYSDMSENEKAALAWDVYISGDNEKRLELVLEASNYAGYGWTADDVSHEGKVKVCLHEESNNSYIEAFYTGISLQAPSISIPDEYNQLIRKGLVQMMQESLSHSVHGNPLPLWYSEGQARYSGGLEVAERFEHEEVDVPMFVDAEDEYGMDSEFLELHYGMAFRYLFNTVDFEERMSLFNIVNVMAKDPSIYTQEGLPEGYDFEPGETGGLESAAFIKAWDEQYIIDEDFNDLTYNRFKHSYHQLLSQ